ncbi:hypothetical protein GNG26_12405 [Leclercia sp. J807]|nr:hypothetical protein [Bacillus amyloliquefaciens]QGU11106.1 hypothetical protein GNG26_12405 [Leclercia sp. J807]
MSARFTARNHAVPQGWVFCRLPLGSILIINAIVVVHPQQREVLMQYVEKDDPREAPESGDKKPQPVKK